MKELVKEIFNRQEEENVYFYISDDIVEVNDYLERIFEEFDIEVNEHNVSDFEAAWNSYIYDLDEEED